MNRYVIAFLVICVSMIMVGTYIHNLPRWCANPQGNGNWMVQPFCPTK